MVELVMRPRRPRLTAERRFFLGMAAAMLVAIFVGFAPSYFLRPWLARPEMLEMTPLVQLHALAFTAWVLLFMVQVSLVSAGQTRLHRRLGGLGLGLAAVLAVLGTLSALYGVGRASGPPEIPPLQFLAVPLVAVPAFTGLILAGLARRRDPQAHKRLMVLAMTVFMPPAFGRMAWAAGPVGVILLPSMFVLALALWDLHSRRSLHPVTLWGGFAAIGSFVLPMLIWTSEGWLAFARWSSGLVS